eukprot:GHRQ01040104.1.p1 GENE.GHRQ01040104.1~~GHRQ01040104.1.p1  ORF type:complete len:113 (+),score=12.24 GHRQ01040104.1:68-406(+)
MYAEGNAGSCPTLHKCLSVCHTQQSLQPSCSSHKQCLLLDPRVAAQAIIHLQRVRQRHPQCLRQAEYEQACQQRSSAKRGKGHQVAATAGSASHHNEGGNDAAHASRLVCVA